MVHATSDEKEKSSRKKSKIKKGSAEDKMLDASIKAIIKKEANAQPREKSSFEKRMIKLGQKSLAKKKR